MQVVSSDIALLRRNGFNATLFLENIRILFELVGDIGGHSVILLLEVVIVLMVDKESDAEENNTLDEHEWD